MRRAAVTALALIAVLTTLARSLPNERPGLKPYPGTGMFLLLSDIHFDPYAEPEIMESIGFNPVEGCRTPPSGAFSNFGSDTNYPLLKSTLDNAVKTAAVNHFHYDYVIVTGDFLAHNFDARYRQCGGTKYEAFQKFAIDTIGFVDGMIAKALPGVPVFAALGNNDSDKGDYQEPTKIFLQRVGQDWSGSWGKLEAGAQVNALESFGKAGNYALPHPTVPNNELVILNSNLWSAKNSQACGGSDPDPGGQFQWLEEVLGRAKHVGGTATLIMHILPGIDAMRSSLGDPQSLWTDRCTENLVEKLTEFRGVVREIYAGHIHRDDFRLFPDRDGRPLATVHVVPAISPVYLNNPAVEVGWYDKSNGELRDYAPQYLDLGSPRPTWATEYIFTQAYGFPRPNLAALEELGREIREGNPTSGVGEKYSKFYGAGVSIFLTPDDWSNYSCAQTETTPSRFSQCTRAGASHRP